MRKRKWLSRAAASTLGITMAFQPVTAPLMQVFAQETSPQADDNQMVSAPEQVYVSEVSAAAREVNFNENWKFRLGDADGAQGSVFDDSKWRSLNLPHDYSIEQEYTQSGEAESGYLPGGIGWYRKSFSLDETAKDKRVYIQFDGVYMNSTVYVNGTQLGVHPYGYSPFSYDITDYLNKEGENVIAVKVNHQTPSSRWYSGSGIYRDVHLVFTEDVHVAYQGLHITSPNVETEKGGNVTTNVAASVENDGDASVSATLKATVYPKGNEEAPIGTATGAAVTIAAGAKADLSTAVAANNPALWSNKNPNLYIVKTEVIVDGKTVDTIETEYGYRYIHFDADTGFSLNGEKMKLKGVCMHHDQGGLGSEANYAAIERQVQILKEMGCNAIRVTHNPASENLRIAADRNGMMLIDELFDGWDQPKNGNSQDYARYFKQAIGSNNALENAAASKTWAQFDTEAAVSAGRNHASVIMYSLGNEINEGVSYSVTKSLADSLISWVQAVDSTKPVTIGDNKIKNSDSFMLDISAKVDAAGGIVGANYANGTQYDTLHRNNPNWLLVGSETASHVNSRGIYTVDEANSGNQSKDGTNLSSYDVSAVGWGHRAAEAWYPIATRDFMAGEFVWTGFDYIGEPTPWNGTGSGAVNGWPSPKSSYFGIIDTAGLPKDNYYFYQSVWNDDVNTLHILPVWTENAVKKDASGNVKVNVYSDAAKVKLYFTPAGSTEKQLVGEKSFTKKTTASGYTYQMYEGSDKKSNEYQNMYLEFRVPYADGELSAEAYDESNQLITNTKGRSSVKTAGPAAALSAETNRKEIDADGKDLAYVTISVVDADGTLVPKADNRVSVTVSGGGVLEALDNGLQTDMQSYYDGNRKAFSGQLVAIVRSDKSGEPIQVKVSASGLEGDTVTINTREVESSGNKVMESVTMNRIYYVKTGTKPVLPESLSVNYSDGTSEDMPVVWEGISDESVAQAGSFTVAGQIAGKTVNVTVNVIDEVGAILNYSTAVRSGQLPTLPDARPAVMGDGEILAANFNVEWDALNKDDFASAGTVTVNGTANVFGTDYPVKATVRVSDGTTTVGGNYAPNAARITQSVPEAEQSDTLMAIVDGSTTISDNNSGGANPTCWSNWGFSKAHQDQKESSITFAYDTQFIVGAAEVYFSRDNGAMQFPEANTLKIEVSEDGGVWTEVDYTETIGEENNRVKCYKYAFDPVTAVYIRLTTTNPTVAGKEFTCVGITEVVLNRATNSFATYDKAELDDLIVNGKNAESAELDSKVISTTSTKADVTPVTNANAAVTVLPEQDDKIVVISEAEDHSARAVYEVRLGADPKPAIDPESDANDIPTSKYTATAANYTPQVGNEGPIEFATDGNTATFWHTDWTSGQTHDASTRWFQIELDEPADVAGLRYLPRQDMVNGRIVKYTIQWKENASDTEWQEKTFIGDWAATTAWKLADFGETVHGQVFRITATNVLGASGQVVPETGKYHATAAEFRLVYPGEAPAIESWTIDIPEKLVVDSVSAAKPAEFDLDAIVVKDGDKDLREGYDYLVSYKNNTKAGVATLVLTGVGSYAGTTERTFTVEVDGEPVVKADKAALQAAYDDVKDLAAPAGFADEYKALTEAADAAKDVLADEDATQDAVNAAAKAITDAKAALVAALEKDLADFVKEAEAAKAEDYKEATWTAITAAKDAAKSLAGKVDLSDLAWQADVADAREKLANPDAEKPAPEVNTEALKAAIDANKDIDLSEYYPEDNEALADAVKAGQDVLTSAESTQDDVDKAAKAIDDAAADLLKAVKMDLASFVTMADSAKEEDYKPATWAAIQDAVEKAAIPDDFTLADFDFAEDIVKAVALIMSPDADKESDFTRLDQAIADAKAIDFGALIPDEQEAFEALIKEAEDLKAEDPGQALVDQKASELAKAADDHYAAASAKAGELIDGFKDLNEEHFDEDELAQVKGHVEHLNTHKDKLDNREATDAFVSGTDLGNEQMMAVVANAGHRYGVVQAVNAAKDTVPATALKDKADALRTALDQANALIEGKTASAEDWSSAKSAVEKAADDLKKAFDDEKAAFNTEAADYDKNKYSDEQNAIIQAALDAVKDAELKDADDVLAKVEAARTELANPKTPDNPDNPDNPEVKVDKSKLQEKVDKYSKAGESAYTAESWKAFAPVLEEAKAILADDNATQAQVDDVLSRLMTVYRDLVVKPQTPGGTTTTNKPSGNSSGTNTGVQAAGWAASGLAAAAAAALTFLFSKKKKK